jgi:acyl-CoA thioester hydrolase
MTVLPFVTYRTRVPAEWVDHNGHFNVGYYMIAFDMATDGLFDAVGLDADYRRRTGNSTYVVDAHLTFAREVLERAPIRIESRIVAADDKRLHFFHQMFAALAASHGTMPPPPELGRSVALRRRPHPLGEASGAS